MQEKKVAIITDVRFRMSLAIIRDLAQAGVYVIAVECNNESAPLGFYSKYVSEKHFIEKDRYEEGLYALCKKTLSEYGQKPVLIPAGSFTLNMLVDKRALFGGVAALCIPTRENLDLLNNKERLHSLAKELGVLVPGEYGPDADVNSKLVVKPAFGERFGLKAWDRYRIVENKAQLDEAVAFFKDACGGETPIIQQYINGDGYGCSVICKNGEILNCIMHKRLREYPKTGGPSTCCESIVEPALLAECEKIVKHLNLNGVCMFEFKKMDGNYYLLEANPRVWGTYPLTRCAKSGFSLSWYEASLNMPQSPKEKALNVKMHYLMADLRVAPGEAIKDALNPKVRGGLFEWGDIKPAIKYVFGKL
ncbi:MAG: ATP-grasp domain-containing protein [Clostridia bacterium]|nr:ATP-grasp domain-containing protein [Clostridia bacterium]